ncbi:cobyrinate a,c-diamide synthase [Aestuariirhabdus litorea]|uniref:Cobyrinate a,c-diamide synthase n=1 Tax=Aestuariirhabdus litorea TaxID=2528527 RepID=A0A3P3VUU8_9GAMM|nr:cobyrinate a,c-diamide synthase [Aestuariirhabdus litorea]RRJ84523.1 cobyrinate a,c-diamide synthase [Aestuariirhabdus litorea]RWW97748.1 cobyrinate a,c-diamide synthase [Endozoicomonadaceae bacterium GTF-13]
MSHSCPAILIAAPASNQGKTTVTAALARLHSNLGRRVRVFKAGPDYLDPMIHEQASRNPVDSLDLWMVGPDRCRELLYEAAKVSDLIIIECGMGLYDGTPSSADLAREFGVPVLAVIDARSMAQTFGALAYGLAHYQPNLPFAGVLANRVGSANHNQMLETSLPEGIRYFGGIPRDERMQLPSRHLGLVQASEVAELEQMLEQGAAVLAEAGITELPDPVSFAPPRVTLELPHTLNGVRIGLACDAAFSFIYPRNRGCLQAMGAELVEFSPLADTTLPEVDALWLPGGYPELHLDALAANRTMLNAVADFCRSGKPVLAECGGMLYLTRTLSCGETTAALCSVLETDARLESRLQGLGLQFIEWPEGSVRGHTFHHSSMDDAPLARWKQAVRQKNGQPGEWFYQQGGVRASYLHLYFESAPAAIASFFRG